MKSHRLRRGSGCVLAAALLGACAQDEAPLPLVGTLERDRIELVAEARERIVEVDVVEGDAVSSGDVLMRLDDSLRRAELAGARAEQTRFEQRLAELIRGPRQEQIREARARLEGARDTLEIQTSELARITDLYERALTSASDVDRARNVQENAEARVEELTATLDALLDGTTKEELAQAEAALAQAEARVEAAEIALSRLQIVAPRDGRVDALPYKLGERPAAGATVIVMLADHAPYARVFVPEPIRARVEPGLAATVRVDGIDGSFEARVRYVSADAVFTPFYALTQHDRSRLAFAAEVTLIDESARALPSGVPVEVDFPSIGQR